jgi:hypothetical protein
VAAPDQLFGEQVDDELGAAVRRRRDALVCRCKLGDTQGILPVGRPILPVLLRSAAMTDLRRPSDVRPAPRNTRPPPTGPRVGSLSITPTGVVFVIALIGSILYLAYAITVRDASQIPLLASGAAVLGFVFGAFSIIGLVATWRSSVHGRDGRAFGHALVGGISFLVAAGCFAAAIILGILARAP